MIYTSYFAKLNKLPSDVIPISIALKTPYWFKGLEYKKLAPSFDILKRWKESHNIAEYTRWFEREVLANLDAEQVFQELSSMAKGKKIVLVCYERIDDFCHRHLVADWFRKNGYPCKEIIL